VPEARFAPDGRGYPDVAAFSVNFNIVLNGNLKAIGGTR
jgi:hypothetical protein